MTRAERPLRIALVAPVAQSVPPPRAGSVESATALLVDGLTTRGHEVTLHATGDSHTAATLSAIYERGYNHDDGMWPWELCELFNLAAAVETADRFDVIHYQAEYAPLSLAFSALTTTPIVQTVHHLPSPTEVALWSRYPDAPFIAVSETQARALRGLHVASTIHHAVDPETHVFRDRPDDYLLFLGRFTEGKGVLPAIDAARRAGHPLVMAAPENDYFHEVVKPLVDDERIIYAGEVGPDRKVALLGGAQALVYPLQAPEPFGLVLIEAMACGTPVAALARGAVEEIVDPGVTGTVSRTLDELVSDLPSVLALDRATVRRRVVQRFGPDRLVEAHLDLYRRIHAGTTPRVEAGPR